MTGARRIAIYLPSMRGGGAERVMATLANGFAERGCQVDLVLARAEGPYLKDLRDDVRLVDLNSGGVLASLPGLVRYLRRECPDAVLSAMTHANVVVIIARVLARSRAKLLISEHTNLSMELKNNFSVKGRLIYRLMRHLYSYTDHLVGVSRGVTNEIISLTSVQADRCVTIYNPIYSKALVDLGMKSFEDTWFKEGEAPVILGAGRLTALKDFHTLIKAFALVRRKVEARLVILGEGEDRELLEALVESLGLRDVVRLAGFVKNPYKYMRRSRVLVLSSRYEGFGNVLVEAMALGTPVVSTRCPSGPDEILEQGKWGELVPVSDTNALAEAILKSMNADRNRAIERARDFAVDRIVSSYLALIEGKPKLQGQLVGSYASENSQSNEV